MAENNISQAVKILRRGGVIAYPTEAVFGLGCDPRQDESIKRLLQIKQRPLEKGLILVASDIAQLEPFIDIAALDAMRWAEIQASWPGPFTWLIPVRPETSIYLRGQHKTLAVRISSHPVVHELCQAFAAPIVSTSANLSGQPPARTGKEVEEQLGSVVDYIVQGEVGDSSRPTEIRDAVSGRIIRQ